MLDDFPIDVTPLGLYTLPRLLGFLALVIPYRPLFRFWHWGYTKERIREHIEMKREWKAVIPKRDYSNKKLVDTTNEKFRNSPGLQRWAATQNLKIATQAYNEAGSIKELEQKIATTAATGKEAKQTVRKLENRRKDLAEIIKYTEQYKTNKPYHIAYKKSQKP